MNLRKSIFAGAVCLVGMAAEALLSGSNATAMMRALRQPVWALPAWAWYFLGLAYYAACFVGLYRVGSAQASIGMRSLGVGLVIAVMAANASWNFIFFRRRDFALSFWFFPPYALLVLILLNILSRIDRISLAVFGAYALYLPYALGWAYRTWKLNGGEAAHHAK